MTVELKVEDIMEIIDREGRPPLTIVEWIEMLESIQSECDLRLNLAREDLRRQSESAQP